MPVVKTRNGWKVARPSGGTYPKFYKTKEEAKKRAEQMEMFGVLRENNLLTKR